jgi:hypothetical protein
MPPMKDMIAEAFLQVDIALTKATAKTMQCEYKPFCNLYKKGSFNCDLNHGKECGRHRANKQGEITIVE